MYIKEKYIDINSSIKLQCACGNKEISLGVLYSRHDDEGDEYYLICEKCGNQLYLIEI